MKMELMFKVAQIIRLEMNKPINVTNFIVAERLRSYNAYKRIMRLLRRRKLLNEETLESKLIDFSTWCFVNYQEHSKLVNDLISEYRKKIN
jgi:hypothetical protein